MFKKPIQIGNKKDLGRKNSAPILEALERYTLSSIVDPGSILQVVPQNIADTLIYLSKSNNEPVAFVKDGDTRIYPSLYFLWGNASVFPTVFVGSAVTGYVLSGADLMLPGVLRQTTGSFNSGELVQLLVPGTTHAFAIGQAEFSSSEIQSLPQDHKGKAVRLIHYFGDGLWKMGSKFIPEGFDFDRISRPKPDPVTTVPVDSNPSPLSADINLSEMDQIAYVTLLDVVKSVTESDLPMNASSLYSRMQFAAKSLSSSSGTFRNKHELPPGKLTLDLKKSSHKSLKEFIEYLSTTKSLISAKSIRGELVIVSLNFFHPDVVQYAKPAEKESSDLTECLIQVTRYYSLTEPWARLLCSSSNELFPDKSRYWICAIRLFERARLVILIWVQIKFSARQMW
jgi:predicted RNA-binding protein (TIGR00451 family)